jgi:(1->4)-alpha-D-glucan 1-alpha-D-glucosylmutase
MNLTERPIESTYRLQFHAGFTFRDAVRVLPYLRHLGITHVYSSPFLTARPGSMHGYDIIDHNAINPEIGSREDYDAWIAALKQHGLGQILDMVPNHMGVGTNDNAWWNDVLENGPASRYAGYFDITWNSSRPELRDKLLLPVLGDSYGDALENGKLRLAFDAGRFTISYYDRVFPLSPRSYAKILGPGIEDLESRLSGEEAALGEYQSILSAVRNLPDRLETDPERLAERQREKEVVKRRLGQLVADNATVREFIAANVARFNGTAGETTSFDLLDDLLSHQCYRLSDWRVASDEINYRRFFDINDLAALNMESEEVFEVTHRLVLAMLAAGDLDGLRIDHPDGLYDPAGYFRRLQESYAKATGSERPLYVVAEKILAQGETLPANWAVDGTSGYDFVNVLNGLFVQPTSAATFTRIYEEWAGDATRFSELAYRKKSLILDTALASEAHMLTHLLDRLAQKSRRSRDFTFNTLRTGLQEVIACFPIYRTYIVDTVLDSDRKPIEFAIRHAALRNPLLSGQLFAFLRSMLLLEYPASFSEADRAEQRRFAGKFQQVTAPVMAKGVEDTAFYVYNRLVSLNEVGGEPGRFGIAPEALHRYCRERQARTPRGLSPLSTHDTKRSEDVRARIDVLSELPDEWAGRAGRWAKSNEVHLKKVEDERVPDANEEYLLYQTLVGAWPMGTPSPEEHADFVARIQAYMRKALYEAKVHSTWINPHAERDAAVADFIAAILDEGRSAAFLADFREFARHIGEFGILNSLSQTLLRLTLPGVPDTYQGSELWDLSLVDPDNRRPVDYARRSAMLADLDTANARDLMAKPEDRRVKLFVTSRALHLRREHPGLFTEGEYAPLTATGERAEHLFAFGRSHAGGRVVVAVPRLVATLAEGGWKDTRLALPSSAKGWRNVFTGEEWRGESVSAAELFAAVPLALLVEA